MDYGGQNWIRLRFNVVMTVTGKKTVFWDVTPRSLIDAYRRFGKRHASVFTLKMEVVGSSETATNVFQNVLHHIPTEDNYLHGFNCFKIGTSGRIVTTVLLIFGFHIGQEIS
jgi:hypothetical protein